MFCIHCGAQLPDSAKFCPNCGANVGAAPSAEPVIADAVVEAVPEVVAAVEVTAAAVVEAVPEVVPEVAAAVEETVAEAVPEVPELPEVEEIAAAAEEAAAEVTEAIPEVEEVAAQAEETVAEAVEEFREPITTLPAPEGIWVAPVPETAPVTERVPAAVGAPAQPEQPAYAPAESQTPVYAQPAVQEVHTPEAPAQSEKGKKEKAPKTSKKGNVGRIILSVLLSILLCLSLLASSLLTIVKLTVTDENVKGAIEKIDFSSLKLDLTGSKSNRVRIADRTASSGTPAASTLGVAVNNGTLVARTVKSDDSEDSSSDTMDDLADILYEAMQGKAEWEDVEKKDIENALKSPLVDEFLTEIATDYTGVLINGESGAGKGLTAERITDFVMAHEDEIRDIVEEAGYKGEFKIDEKKLEQAIRDQIGDQYAPDTIAEEYSKYIEPLRLVLSWPAVIGLWVITALLIVLLILVNKRRISAVLSCVGIPALIVGLLYLLAWVAMTVLPRMKEGLLSLIPTFIGSYTLIVGAGLAGGGLLFIIIKAIIRAVQKKKA